ncbi:MAG TPA: hypothetical protein VFD58_10130 [Blastocatellia bacterium]|nr:hypothetical protein [Blastocatellia bacterium]
MKPGNKFLLATLLVPLLATPAGAQESHQHQHEATEQLGQVNFRVSCNPAAQKQFNRAAALLHSFWYDSAEQAFAEITVTDPRCAMGYWGIAMSNFHPIWEPPSAAELKRGQAAIEKAKAAGAKTQRERDYIAALEVFYKDYDTLDHRTRALAYERAMEQVYLRYPEDREAAIFYALILIGNGMKDNNKSYTKEKQAAVILNKILPEEPNHPGIAHYLIHSYDYPQLAHLALPAAEQYAKIAPSAPHALHMPSHIFTRLGLWQQSIESNIASATAARNVVAKTHPGAASQNQLHAMDYLTYAYLQGAQDQKAKGVVDEAGNVSRVDQEVFQAAYAFAAIPARYALERRRWDEAAGLKLHPASFPWEQFRFAEAITYFARAVGAARSGNTASARQEVEKLSSIQKALAVVKKGYDWATQVEIERRAASAWLAHAEGKNEEALALMRSAAELEDSTDKHPVTPGAIIPAREMLGDLLLELNQPAQAVREFELSLQNAPKRFNSHYGLARAAAASGDEKKARAHYAELVALCNNADGDRPELQKAKEFLAERQVKQSEK